MNTPVSKEERLKEEVKVLLSRVESEKFRRTFMKLIENAQNRKKSNSYLI